jgi:hypothetical protein
MDIEFSKKELIEYAKLKYLSEITLTKEKLNLFEKKYSCTLNELKKKNRKIGRKFRKMG